VITVGRFVYTDCTKWSLKTVRTLTNLNAIALKCLTSIALLCIVAISTVSAQRVFELAPEATRAAFSHFGSSVDVDGETAVVGAEWDRGLGIASGAAYVFEKGDESWDLVTILTASDAGGADHFGRTIAIEDTVIVVGAEFADAPEENSGAVYIFEKSNGIWAESAKLVAPDGMADAGFGKSIAISDGFVVIGAPFDSQNGASSGAVYVAVKSVGTWNVDFTIRPENPDVVDWFGMSVDVSAGMGEAALIVGAPGDDDFVDDAGAAYYYRWDGQDFNFQSKALPEYPLWHETEPGGLYGSTVAFLGNTSGATPITSFAIQEPGNEMLWNVGLASPNQIDPWWEAPIWVMDKRSGDSFGAAVDSDESGTVIGAPTGIIGGIASGTAHIMGLDSEGFSTIYGLAPSNPLAGDNVGWDVGISDGVVIVSAPLSDEHGNESGSVVIYDPFLERAQLEVNPPSFTNHVIHDGNRQGTGLDIGDVDGDGDADIVASFTTGGWLSLYTNTDLTFTRSRLADLSTPSDVALADVDGDTDLDVISTSLHGSTTNIYRNSLNGFEESIFSDIGATPRSVDTGDWNGDGIIDIITGWNLEVVVHDVLTGERMIPRLATFPGVEDLVPFDVNADGDLDVVFSGPHWINVMYNEPQTWEKFGLLPSEFPFTPMQVMTAESVDGIDVSRFGVLSGYENTIMVAVTLRNQISSPIVWSIFGGFALQPSNSVPHVITENGQAVDVKIVDLDDDGLMDLVTAARFRGTIEVYLDAFNPARYPITPHVLGDANGADPSVIEIYDLNEDGLLDIVYLSVGSGYVLGWLEQNGVSDTAVDVQLPENYDLVLTDPWPNPFSTVSNLAISVSSPQRVVIEVFNILGHKVETLSDGYIVDEKAIRWNASGFPAGVYFVRAMGETNSRTIKLIHN